MHTTCTPDTVPAGLLPRPCNTPPAGEEVLYDEEFTEGEVLDELAPLSTQLAYVLGLQGQHEAALERLDPLVSGHLSDPAVGAVAANNWVVDSYASGGPHSHPADSSCQVVLASRDIRRRWAYQCQACA